MTSAPDAITLSSITLDCADAAGLADETLSKYGVQESDIPALAANSISAMGGIFAFTPVTQAQADVERIFRRAYK